VHTYIALVIYKKVRKFSYYTGKEIDFVYTVTDNTSNYDNTWLSQINHGSGTHNTVVLPTLLYSSFQAMCGWQRYQLVLLLVHCSALLRRRTVLSS
jgi:hypothetical protein